ncbi:MAG: PilC/PilY family type IV pilus protein [Sideroxydans sp.]
MNTFARSARFVSTALLFGAMLNAHSATTDLANAPLITSPTSSVLPNVFLMLDDSGSMGWDYMPDNASDFNSPAYGGASNQCNGVFYDPNITYDPPVDSTGTSYANSSFTSAWNDGYDTAGGSTNLSTSFVPSGGGTAAPAYYFKYVGTQTTERLKDYYNTSSTFYTECNTSATSAKITVGSGTSSVVSSIKVNTTIEILSAPIAGSGTTSTAASQIAANINACSAVITGNCTSTGYSATVSGSVVTIWPPSTVATGSPSVTKTSGSQTFTTTAFPTPKFIRVVVSSTSGPGATDERTNFANWWSYYHNRMLTMKTATGRAFSSIGTTFRVGYGSLNNNTGSDMLQLDTFDTTQKANWYTKLYAATPNNSTPLREALSKVGRMYAGKQTTFNGATITDPIQYSCQQNFTILTTDGFWNGNAGFKVDGSSAIGNQDYFEPRAMYDGSSVVSTTTTPYTTVQQRQAVTTGAVTTVTWQSIYTTVGAACSTSTVVPANTVSAYMYDDYNIALGLSASDPDPGYCYNLAADAWACRSHNTSSSTYPVVSQSSVTDSTGKPWYLVSSGSTLGSGCINDEVLFSNTNYSKRKGACSGTAAVTGNLVTVTPRTLKEVLSGSTTTSVNDYTANQSTTQTTSNGIVGPVSALTPTTPTYNFTSNVSTSSTPPTSDVWDSSWTDGTSTTTCVATASLPVPSWVWATPDRTTSSTAGTTTTTVLSTVGPTAGTPNTTGTSSGGTSDTLADTAEYYYITDLRTTALGNNLSGAPGAVNGSDISANNVPSSGLDAASHQHMTTFTLGLGARGKMVFDPAYESATTSDFYWVKQGSTANGTTVCPWQASGSCNWPTPAANSVANIDDLWHAAVNGRGTYFSAANPTGLATALSSALAGVSARTGSAAAATTSNAFVTQGDNFLFRSTFVSQQWTGELIRQQLDVTTGDVLPTIDWSAQSKLDANSSRNIYFFDSGASNKLSSFTLANLTTAGLNSYFATAHISTLSQLCGVGGTCLANWAASTPYVAGNEYRNGTTWYHVNTAYTSGLTFGATDTTNSSVVTGVAGTNLVNFIRGDRTYEGASTDTDFGKYYRQRNHVMGDIVSSESNYVKGALSINYADDGYSPTHINAMADRQPMVYVGGNDGMLHAFYAADGRMDSTTGHIVASGGVNVLGGDEAWAFIPTAVIPNLYKLADKNYSLQHQYYVDGSPVTADICVSNCTTPGSAVWKTILVSGLNGGGKSYFALDITNPAQPKALWEFTDANLGYTYGNPKVVKLKPTLSYPGGQWVVLLTSGYNNDSGNGQGYLYVVDAYTGALATDVNGTGIIGTGVGSVATPSGLGRLDAPLVTPGVDATAMAVYAGDMLGNLWRFDINGDLGAAGYDAQLLATLEDASGNAQPITTKPILSLVGTTLVVYVGTGRYLGSSDLPDTNQQSFYAIKDTYPTGTTPSVAIHGVPRSGGFIQQSQTTTTCPVGSSANICTTGESVVVSSNTAVSFSTHGGWFFDFPLAGERVNTDPAIIDATLIFNTNVPNASSCSVGGDSFQYQLNYSTGGSVSSSPLGVVAHKLGNELATRPVVATLIDGRNKAYSQGSGGNTPDAGDVWRNTEEGGGRIATGQPSRKSWRVLIQQ